MACALLLAGAGLARAEDPAPERGGETATDAEPRARARVRAVRMAELPEDPSSFATSIESEDFEGEATSTPRALSRSVGVQVRSFGGPGQPSEISIRGSTGRQVVVMLDGVRINSAQTGSADLSTIPFDLVERIEVSRGGGSVQAGPDAIGGVVNVVTRQPGPEPRTAATFSGGSFGTYEGSLTHSRRTEDGLGLSLGYRGFYTDGDWDFETLESQGVVTVPSRQEQRVNNDVESHAGLARVSKELGDGALVTASEQLFYVSRGQPGFSNRQSEDAREYRTRNVADVRLELDDLADGRLRLDSRLFHRFERVRFKDPSPPPPEQPLNNLDKHHSGGGRFSLEGDAVTGPVTHLASAGLDTRGEWLDSRQFGDRDRVIVGAAVQDELSLFDERVTLIPALRFDRTEGFGREWVPRLGAILAPWPWLRIKGNVEKAYRVPSYDELFFDFGSLRGNPNLKPERATNWDVGLELGVAELGPLENLRVQVAWFDSDIKNSIVFQVVSPNTVQATNSDDAEIEGVELSGGFELLGWLGFSGNYTWQDADLKGSRGRGEIQGGDGALPGRAETEWSLRARLGPPSGAWKLVGEQHHVSKIPVTFSGNTFVSERTTYDASLTVDLMQFLPWSFRARPESFLLSFNAVNFTDRAVRDALAFPQPGRSFTLRGEVRW